MSTKKISKSPRMTQLDGAISAPKAVKVNSPPLSRTASNRSRASDSNGCITIYRKGASTNSMDSDTDKTKVKPQPRPVKLSSPKVDVTKPLDQDRLLCSGSICTYTIEAPAAYVERTNINTWQASEGDLLVVPVAEEGEVQGEGVMDLNPCLKSAQAWCMLHVNDNMWVGCSDAIIRIFDNRTLELVDEISNHSAGVQSLFRLGSYVLSGSQDFSINMWNVETLKCVQSLIGHSGYVRCLGMFETKICSGGDDAELRLWNVATGQEVATLGKQEVLGCAALSMKSTPTHVWAGYSDAKIRVWNVDDQSCEQALTAHTAPVVALERIGVSILSASSDGVRIWTFAGITVGVLPPLDMHTGPILSLKASLVADTFSILVGGSTRMRVWNISEKGGQILGIPFMSGTIPKVEHLILMERQQEATRVAMVQVQISSALETHVERIVQQLEVQTRQMGMALQPSKNGQATGADNLEQYVDQICQKLGRATSRTPSSNEMKERLKDMHAFTKELKMTNQNLSKEVGTLTHELIAAQAQIRAQELIIESQRVSIKNNYNLQMEMQSNFRKTESYIKKLQNEILNLADENSGLSRMILHRDAKNKQLVQDLNELTKKCEQMQISLIATEAEAEGLSELKEKCSSLRLDLQRSQNEKYECEIQMADMASQLRNYMDNEAAGSNLKQRSRSLLLRSLQQLGKGIVQSNHLLPEATALIRDMVFERHGVHVIEEDLENIQSKYSPIFEIFDYVKAWQDEIRDIFTTCLNQVERLHLGIPSDGYASDRSKLDTISITPSKLSLAPSHVTTGSLAEYLPKRSPARLSALDVSDIKSLDDSSPHSHRSCDLNKHCNPDDAFADPHWSKPGPLF